MSEKPTYDELIEAVGRMEGPDWEIDSKIACAFELFKGTRASYDLNRNLIPAYTASTDSALLLVPEEWSYVLLHDHGRPARAGLRGRRADNFASVDAEAATLPLAICSAALRAAALKARMEPNP